MSPKLQHVSAVVLLLAFGLALGCGGNGSGDGSAVSEGISKTEFLRRGNAICSERSSDITADAGRIFKRNSKTPDRAQRQLVSRVLVPNFEAEIRELRALGEPPGDGKQVAAVLNAIGDTIDRLRTSPPIKASLSFKANHPYRPGEEIAARYGLTACGHP